MSVHASETVDSSRRVLFLYKQTSLRAEALAAGGSASFTLYGLPELAEEGWPLEAVFGQSDTGIRGIAGALLRRWNHWEIGYSANPRAVLPHFGKLRGAIGIVATSNNVGLPLLQLKRRRLVTAPVFLLSVGLEAYRSDADSPRRRRLSRLLRYAEKILVFSQTEKQFLVERLDLRPGKVDAVPYGFAPRYFPAFREERPLLKEIFTVGADAQRDMELLREWSLRHPETRIRAILSREIVERLPMVPDSWVLENDVPLETVLARLAEASLVVIPVKENLYTAGTTFLLQALAAGVPTLVARTGALAAMPEAEPFPFLTYEPGNPASFADGMQRLLALGPEERRQRSRDGRRWAERWGDGRELRRELEDFVERCTEA